MGLIVKIIFGIALNGGALYVMTEFVDGVTYTGGLTFFVIGGVVVGLLNSLIKPILKAFSMPLIFITGGVFLIVINGLLLWFLSYFLDVIQFRDVTLVFQNLGTYAIGALVFGVINWLEHLIF
ncbi:MAG: phage holin family protein [Candidatus Gracilibacteria bacterium]